MKVLTALLLLASIAALSFAASDCDSYSNCGTCTDTPDCKWCDREGGCFPLGSGEELCPSDDWSIVTSDCGAVTTPTPTVDCNRYTSCGTCAATRDCKWCETNDRCFPLGSGQDVCPGSDWSLYSEDCSDILVPTPTIPPRTPAPTPTRTPTRTATPYPTPGGSQTSSSLPCCPAAFIMAAAGLGLIAYKRI